MKPYQPVPSFYMRIIRPLVPNPPPLTSTLSKMCKWSLTTGRRYTVCYIYKKVVRHWDQLTKQRTISINQRTNTPLFYTSRGSAHVKRSIATMEYPSLIPPDNNTVSESSTAPSSVPTHILSEGDYVNKIHNSAIFIPQTENNNVNLIEDKNDPPLQTTRICQGQYTTYHQHLTFINFYQVVWSTINMTPLHQGKW